MVPCCTCVVYGHIFTWLTIGWWLILFWKRWRYFNHWGNLPPHSRREREVTFPTHHSYFPLNWDPLCCDSVFTRWKMAGQDFETSFHPHHHHPSSLPSPPPGKSGCEVDKFLRDFGARRPAETVHLRRAGKGWCHVTSWRSVCVKPIKSRPNVCEAFGLDYAKLFMETNELIELNSHCFSLRETGLKPDKSHA